MLKINRPNLILASCLLLQLGAIPLIRYGTRAPEKLYSTHSRQLLNDWQLADLKQIAITDERGLTVMLQFNGTDWVLPALKDYPVDPQKLAAAFNKLLAIASNHQVTSLAEKAWEMAVSEDHFRRRIQLVSENRAQTIYLGNSPSSSYCHLRLDGFKEIWAVNGLDEWLFPASAKEWLQTAYLEFADQDLRYLAIDGGSLQFTIERAENEDWHWPNAYAAEMAPPDQEQLAAIVNELSLLEIDNVSAPFNGLPRKNMFTITLRGKESYQLYLWPGPEKSQIYLQGKTHIVTLDNWRISELLKLVNTK